VTCVPDDDEPTPPGILAAHQLQPRRSVFVPADQDMLQQISEVRFDGAFVLRIDFDEISQGAHLPDLPVGLDEHHARRITELRAVYIKFFERTQPCVE